jgi:hypothetical protein
MELTQKDIKKLDFILDKMIETGWLVTANDLHLKGYYDEHNDDIYKIEKDFKYLLSVFSTMNIGEVSMTADAEMVRPNDKAILFHRNGGFKEYVENLSSHKKNKEENFKKEKERQNLSDEINRLTKVNLELQNKQMKRYILYSVISFILGAITTNIKSILNMF